MYFIVVVWDRKTMCEIKIIIFLECFSSSVVCCVVWNILDDVEFAIFFVLCSV